MAEGSEERPRGVFAAALTPLNAALEPDTSMLVAHCRWLLEQGCDGVVPIGTTGEGNSLSVRQRLTIVEAIKRAGIPMTRFIIGTGSCALADAVEMTRAATEAGAAGVLVIPPFYYKEPSEEGLARFYSELIDRVNDGRLRLYLYHFPQLSTVAITPGLIKRLLAAYPRTIAGLKDSSGDWPYSARLLQEFPGFDVFSGSEGYLLANLRGGGAGCISANVNVTAPVARKVFLAWREEQAAQLQKELDGTRAVLDKYPLPAAVKHVMAAISGNPGWNRILPPNRPLTEQQGRELMASLAALPEMRPLVGAAAR
ncbi:MAG TPA: dihydrodipicolinate synthase family protein [Candidatus Binataceae bacterium]|jgi:4-hydroxy-tetrahydrodipicolinate synthase|nr:dihydrodipicolinate synthase family protein [Candidatus Binataceae bacterium]